jgi:hypothetical protein
MEELISAFDDSSPELKFYVDVETGAAVLVTDETRGDRNRIFEEVYGEGDESRLPFEGALAQSDLHDWQQDAVRTADPVEAGFGTRFIGVPKAESYEGYDDMEAFIETVQDGRFQNRLWRAIHGRGAFRRFKDTLFEEPSERDRWFAFRDERLRQRVMRWLEAEEIEPVDE